MSYRPSSLLPLTILQLVRRTLSQIIESSTSLFPRALPASLVGLVPDCTANCLDSFISANYQTSECSNNLDLTCLCTHTTPSGLAIGEAALQCLVSSCPSKDEVDESSVYNICSGIPNAVPETVGTIIITMVSTTLLSGTALTTAGPLISSTLPSSILVPSTSLGSISSIVSDTGTPMIPAPTSSPGHTTMITASTPAPFLKSFSSSISASSTPSSRSPSSIQSNTSSSVIQPAAQTTSSLAVAAPVANQQISLTTGQIVGIAVAGGAAAFFAVGVLIFVFCLRKRKRQRRRSARGSMAGEKPPPRPSTPSHDSGHARTAFADPADLAIGHGQRYYAEPPVEGKRRSFWRRSIKPEDIGVAVSPQAVQDGSPDSYSSQRTASQLLPALPNYALWPAPLRLIRHVPTARGAIRPESTATVFEEDAGRDMSTHNAITVPHEPSSIESRQEMTQRVVPAQVGSAPPVDPRAQMYALERATAIATKSDVTLTPVYDNGIHTPVYDKVTSAGVIPGSGQGVISILPQPYYSSTLAEVPRRAPSPQANVMHQRHLQTYSSAPNLPRNQQHYPRNSASTPSLSAATGHTDKRSTMARKGSIDSAGSDVTTFDTDEDTTPEQELDQRLKPSMLSPVVESPARLPATFSEQGSPIKGLKYPRVPRPAAVARQAEKAPRPRAALQINTSGSQLQPPRTTMTRDQLVRDERSFLQSQSTSQASPEPSPALLAKRRGDRAAGQMLQGGLKLSSDSANRMAPKHGKWQVMKPQEQPLQSPRKPKLVLDTRSPVVENERVSKRNSVGLTPTRRGGDLFLTVH